MKEIKRLYLVKQILDKHMTAPQAAELLGFSLRQIRRIIARYREQGAPGIVHGNRGKRPNNQIEQAVRDKIVELTEDICRRLQAAHRLQYNIDLAHAEPFQCAHYPCQEND